MNKRYKVTIIIPVYNAELFIEKCARSLFEQTLKDIEFIFVDDCSTDGSVQLLSELLEQYPERIEDVRIIRHEVNKGSASARNTALDSATGEYIGWTDSDDWTAPVMFENLYNTAVSYAADVVWCDFEEVFSDHVHFANQYLKEETGPGQAKAIVSGRFGGMLWNKIMRRSHLEKYNIRFLDGCNMAEDKNLCVKVFSLAGKVKHLPETLYYYSHTNSGSQTNKFVSKRITEEIENTNNLLSFFSQHGINCFTKQELTFLKLYSKEKLLLSTDIGDLARWTEIFPDVNYSMLTYHRLHFHHKLIALFSIWKWWCPLRLWTKLKKMKSGE